MSTKTLDLLADLLEHPDPRFADQLEAAIRNLETEHGQAAGRLKEFRELLPLDDQGALTELHTRTFDVQPITTLDLGYVLFGEDYRRGALLANLNSEHNRAGVQCGLELADHLGNILQLLGRLEDIELAEELARCLVVPALNEMILEFTPERLARKEELFRRHHKTVIEWREDGSRLAYCLLLEAVREVVAGKFGLDLSPGVDAGSSFARAIGTEMGLEGCGACVTQSGEKT